MATVKVCSRCNRECRNPQRVDTFVPTLLKTNGWVGNQFIPYDRVYSKSYRVNRPVMCGLCAATEYVEREKEGGADVTELETALLDMALKEFDAAMGAMAPAPVDGTNKSNGHKSRGNAEAVLAAIAGTCECQPYQDVLPYEAWLRRGQPVRAGQHAIVKVVVGRRSVALFCRCQTMAGG